MALGVATAGAAEATGMPRDVFKLMMFLQISCYVGIRYASCKKRSLLTKYNIRHLCSNGYVSFATLFSIVYIIYIYRNSGFTCININRKFSSC